jgi:hypothetical protein
MLKELNRLSLLARRQAAAWRRWSRKLPHNRVSRPRLRDEQGRIVGYGAREPILEPPIPKWFCERVELPSGKIELVLTGAKIETAYRQARQPKPTPQELPALSLTEEQIRRLFVEYCQ